MLFEVLLMHNQKIFNRIVNFLKRFLSVLNRIRENLITSHGGLEARRFT